MTITVMRSTDTTITTRTPLTLVTMPCVWAGVSTTKHTRHTTMMMDLISMAQEGAAAAAVAQNVNGSFTLGLAGAGAGIGIGLIGGKAVEAVGRNPGAFGNILTLGIIGMALAEAIAIYALIIAFGGR
jgi:F-type H+-transporting ATPase subunit c